MPTQLCELREEIDHLSATYERLLGLWQQDLARVISERLPHRGPAAGTHRLPKILGLDALFEAGPAGDAVLELRAERKAR